MESHKNLTFLITLDFKLHVYMVTDSIHSTRTKWFLAPDDHENSFTVTINSL